MPTSLPLDTTLPNYEFQIVLDAVTYTIECRWNTREEAWYLNISLEDGTPIASGVRVVVNHPLAARATHELKPFGLLVAIDTSNADLDPGLSDFGSRVQLLYYDSSEVQRI